MVRGPRYFLGQAIVPASIGQICWLAGTQTSACFRTLNPEPTIQNAVKAIAKNLENKVSDDVGMGEYVEVIERSWIVRGLRVAGIRTARIPRVALKMKRSKSECLAESRATS